ncbi:TIGR04283 family arsenosugar biosynthesis glycosyltransferase [Allosphingosinicella deserti]|uniref:TIGR04283 family arsenosugar biosynthesis glycosyltransferase n=1 Tax=Allosphingosinicella deserti TaxID=2116704 RepID=UPI0018EAC059|nr:TIGR04283 family arsenosugar biosynthesis glycosyltransferase [Sphingomonas deserti]
MPTLDAAATLPACLAALAGADEVIVADGGSADATCDIAATAGATVIVGARGRGRQLAAGAEAASGDWLLFLHADTILSADWRSAVLDHVRAAPDRPGCFRFQLDDRAWQARLIERGVAVRVRLLGLPYGDQGLLVSRPVYDVAGGYRPLPLMEDVDLVRRLLRPALLGADAVTSADRWRRDGWFRRSARNLALLTLWRLGLSPAAAARLYG